jgi:hypothetical protein
MKKLIIYLIFGLVMLSWISPGSAAPKNWQKYQDPIAHFSIQFPKDWSSQFYTTKDVLRAGGSIGAIANASQNLMINFTVMKHIDMKNFNQRITDLLEPKSKIYLKTDHINHDPRNVRFDLCFKLTQEVYLVRQYLNIDPEHTLIVEISLPKASFLKKDAHYKLVTEIMNTLAKSK